jgi:hypothetical protein
MPLVDLHHFASRIDQAKSFLSARRRKRHKGPEGRKKAARPRKPQALNLCGQKVMSGAAGRNGEASWASWK